MTIQFSAHYNFLLQIKNLTHLDVSENSIEKLDISALQELKSVRCARNYLTELTLCGRNLVSLIAGNNSEYISIIYIYIIYVVTIMFFNWENYLKQKKESLKNSSILFILKHNYIII